MKRETRIKALYVVSILILFSTLLALDNSFISNALKYQETIQEIKSNYFLTKE